MYININKVKYDNNERRINTIFKDNWEASVWEMLLPDYTDL